MSSASLPHLPRTDSSSVRASLRGKLDCSGTPDDVWSQLLVVGRLMRPAVTGVNRALDRVPIQGLKP